MEPTTSNKLSDEEMRWAIAEEAKVELERLNPDYLIDSYDIADPEGTRRSIRFGDLPVEVQEGIRRGLESNARGESTRWEYGQTGKTS